MYRIYILSHNRPDFITQCIKSVERAVSGISDVEVIISENSPSSDVLDLLKKESIESTLRKRKNYMNGLEHINFCLNEAKSDGMKYVCIFHDDDQMFPEFITKTLRAFQENNIAPACGFDISKKNKNFEIEKYSKKNMMSYIFGIGKSSIIPFPSFTYNLEIIDDLYLDETIGKHADAEFLLRVAEKGDIVIIKSTQIKSEVHPQSDSYNESISHRRKLINAVIERHNCDKSMFIPYRIAYILRKKQFNRPNFKVFISKRFIPIFIFHALNYLKSFYRKNR